MKSSCRLLVSLKIVHKDCYSCVHIVLDHRLVPWGITYHSSTITQPSVFALVLATRVQTLVLLWLIVYCYLFTAYFERYSLVSSALGLIGRRELSSQSQNESLNAALLFSSVQRAKENAHSIDLLSPVKTKLQEMSLVQVNDGKVLIFHFRLVCFLGEPARDLRRSGCLNPKNGRLGR